ncbi:MAG: hypothetical protein H6702_19735 [Myxococcales bacterium]|nr:hypothetical protein [Myxococcales bacterium]
MRWLMAALGATALTGCAPEGTKAPTPPDTQALRDTFTAPSGRLTAQSAQAVVSTLEARLQEVADVASLLTLGTGAVGALTGTVAVEHGLSAADGEAASSAGWALESRHDGLTVGVEAGGWVVLERRCPGWGDPDERGQIALTAVATSASGFADTLWGAARGCRAIRGADGARLRYDADIRLVVPDFERPSELMLQIAGAVTVDGATREYDFRARFAEGRAFLSQRLDEGQSLLLGLDFEKLGQAQTLEDLLDGLEVVDAQGTWTCDLQGCTGPGGEIAW